MFISIRRIWKCHFDVHNPKSLYSQTRLTPKNGQIDHFPVWKYRPLVGKRLKFHRTLIPWQHFTENIISQQILGKPICRNSNANSEPWNWPNMPSYSGLENTGYKVPDFKTYRHVVTYKFPVSVSGFWPRFGFSPVPEKSISGFKTRPAIGCRLIVKNTKDLTYQIWGWKSKVGRQAGRQAGRPF